MIIRLKIKTLFSLIIILGSLLLLSSCSTTKVYVKNCKQLDDVVSECEEI